METPPTVGPRATPGATDAERWCETCVPAGPFESSCPTHPNEALFSAAALRKKRDEPILLTELGGYRLGYRLGFGGYGGVYEAMRLSDGARFAVKVLREELIAKDRDVARKEAAVLTRLQPARHPNIVRFVEHGEDQGRHYLVMELLEGKDLRSRLGPQAAPIPVVEALRIAIGIACGLAVAHRGGKPYGAGRRDANTPEAPILHHDVKPANVFLSGPDGLVKLLDFGIAKVVADVGEEGDTATLHAVAGTTEYMSPEAHRAIARAFTEKLPGRPYAVGVKSDLYSLGVVLFEMLVGSRPHQRVGATDLQIQFVPLLRDAFKRDKFELGSDEDAEALERLLDGLLSKDPTKRPDCAQRVLATLGRIEGVVEELEARRGADVERLTLCRELADNGGDTGPLLKALKTAATEAPNEAEQLPYRLEMAKVLDSTGAEATKRIAAWREVHRLDRDHEGAYAALKDLYRADQSWPKLAELIEARATLRRSRPLGLPQDPRRRDLAAELHQLARVYRDELRQLDKAALAFESIVSLDPEDDAALACLDELYERLNQWDPLFETLARRATATKDRLQRSQRLARLATLWVRKPLAKTAVPKLMSFAERLEDWDVLLTAVMPEDEGQRERFAQLVRGLAKIAADELEDAGRAIRAWSLVREVNRGSAHARAALEALRPLLEAAGDDAALEGALRELITSRESKAGEIAPPKGKASKAGGKNSSKPDEAALDLARLYMQLAGLDTPTARAERLSLREKAVRLALEAESPTEASAFAHVAFLDGFDRAALVLVEIAAGATGGPDAVLKALELLLHSVKSKPARVWLLRRTIEVAEKGARPPDSEPEIAGRLGSHDPGVLARFDKKYRRAKSWASVAWLHGAVARESADWGDPGARYFALLARADASERVATGAHRATFLAQARKCYQELVTLDPNDEHSKSELDRLTRLLARPPLADAVAHALEQIQSAGPTKVGVSSDAAIPLKPADFEPEYADDWPGITVPTLAEPELPPPLAEELENRPRSPSAVAPPPATQPKPPSAKPSQPAPPPTSTPAVAPAPVADTQQVVAAPSRSRVASDPPPNVWLSAVTWAGAFAIPLAIMGIVAWAPDPGWQSMCAGGLIASPMLAWLVVHAEGWIGQELRATPSLLGLAAFLLRSGVGFAGLCLLGGGFFVGTLFVAASVQGFETMEPARRLWLPLASAACVTGFVAGLLGASVQRHWPHPRPLARISSGHWIVAALFSGTGLVAGAIWFGQIVAVAHDHRSVMALDPTVTLATSRCVATSGSVTCWPDDASYSRRATLRGVRQLVEAGPETTCALTESGVWCWQGADVEHRWAGPSFGESARILAGGPSGLCAVLGDGALKCGGGCADPSAEGRFDGVVVGNGVACGLRDANRQVSCWSCEAGRALPLWARESLSADRVSISTGYLCWVRGTDVDCSAGWPVAGDSRWNGFDGITVQVATTTNAACIRTRQNEVFCQGHNPDGQLGIDPSDEREDGTEIGTVLTRPTRVPALTGATSIRFAGNHLCARIDDSWQCTCRRGTQGRDCGALQLAPHVH